MKVVFDRQYKGASIIAAFQKTFESMGDGKTTRWKISEETHNFQIEVGLTQGIVGLNDYIYQSVSALPERMIFGTPFGGKVWRFDILEWEGLGWIGLTPIIAEKEYWEIDLVFAGITAAQEEAQYLEKKLPDIRNIILAFYENLLKVSVKKAA